MKPYHVPWHRLPAWHCRKNSSSNVTQSSFGNQHCHSIQICPDDKAGRLIEIGIWPLQPLHLVRCTYPMLTNGLLVRHSALDLPDRRPRRPGRRLRPGAGAAGGASSTAAAAEHGPRQHRQHIHIRGQSATPVRSGVGSPPAALLLLQMRPVTQNHVILHQVVCGPHKAYLVMHSLEVCRSE